MTGVGIDVSKQWLDVVIAGRGCVRWPNTAAGAADLAAQLEGLEQARIVLEASGGYERVVLRACADAGLRVHRVNARQARDFARATGQLAKTDALDAGVLAHMASCLSDSLRVHVGGEPWRERMQAWVRRRSQLVEMLQQQRQQLSLILIPTKLLLFLDEA